MMTSGLCRGARGLLDWSRKDLAQVAGVHFNVIVKYETGLGVSDESKRLIEAAFEQNGVTLSDGRTVQTIKRSKASPHKEGK